MINTTKDFTNHVDEDLEDLTGRTIMVIDDDENNLTILETYLVDAGYEVITATNGSEAWDFIKLFGQDISVILLDRMMPVMNGMDFLKLLKGHPKHFDIPVIMQTAAAMKNQVAEGIQSGVYYYLRKPFDQTKVMELIEGALRGQRNLRELRKKNMIDKEKSISCVVDPNMYKNLE